MIKFIKRLLPAALALALAGCAALPQDAPTSRYKVALIAKSTGLEFWNAVFTGAQAAATEYNIDLVVTAPENEEDFEGQNALIEDAVADGAKAIIFSAIDYEANAALDGVPGQLNVGLINYEVNGANGRDRAAGAKDAFEQSGRAKVVATAQTHPNADDARRDALEMLRDHPEINVLIALNEPSGVGTARAVHQMQRADDLWLVAFDSNLATIDALQNGAVDALVVQNSYSMGYFGVQSAYRLLAGQGSSVSTDNIANAAVITRDNMFAMDNQRELFLFE